MRTSPITPLGPSRKRGMPRPIVFIILLIVVLAAAIYFLASQAREVPTRPIEVDVTNAAGR